MRPAPDIKIIDNYLAGNATSEEVAQINAWVGDSREYRNLLADMQAGSDSLGRPAGHWDSNQMWSRLKAKRDGGNAGLAEESRISRPSRTLRAALISGNTWMLTAAATLVLALVAIGVTGKYELNRLINSSSSSVARDIITAKGQRLTIELVDGTRVIVAPESRMSIHEDYGELNRMITVEGEAYFTVANDKGMPFIVKSGDVYTRVLGTSFSVRKYENDRQIRVVVVEGRVSVNEAVVGAGDVASVDSGNIIRVNSSGNLNSYIGWVTGKFDFVDSPLDSVVRELNRAYDIDIVLADAELEEYRISAAFENQTVAQILTDIALATNSSLQYSGRQVFIKKTHTSGGESEKNAVKPNRGDSSK